MRFELMLPYQIKEAITKHTPVVLPIGVMEYHGEHMAVGHGHPCRDQELG
jgi:creatinine amidohydrolase